MKSQPKYTKGQTVRDNVAQKNFKIATFPKWRKETKSMNGCWMYAKDDGSDVWNWRPEYELSEA